MRSLWSVARNLSCLAIPEGEGPDAPGVLVPTAEIVLMIAEIRYRPGADGSGVEKYRDLDTVRFSATAEALAEHIRFLLGVHNELVDLEEELGDAGLLPASAGDLAAAEDEVTP